MEYWIWLSLLPYIGPVTANRLLEYFKEPLKVYHAESTKLMQVKGITKRQVQSIISNKSLEPSWRLMDSCLKNDISVVLSKVS